MKTTKNINHSTVTREFKKFCSSSKNLDNLARSARVKSMNFEAVLQAIEANLVNSPEFIKQVQHPTIHLYNLCKSIHSCHIGLHINKILQNF